MTEPVRFIVSVDWESTNLVNMSSQGNGAVYQTGSDTVSIPFLSHKHVNYDILMIISTSSSDEMSHK